MLKRLAVILSLPLMLAPVARADDTAAVAAERILFVYDTIDKSNSFYVATLRELLVAEGYQVKEARAGELLQSGAGPYDRVVIYGMVMAFNWKSMVRDWMKAQTDLSNRKAHVFVTANRWFRENLLRDLVKLTKEKRATVVDAVSMATNKVSDADKKEKMRSFVAGLKK
ncbi:MAG: hypothetical protein JXA71_04840 [Chitinispirillaceae bacterium]|nr:hypothetical protein [Chitinispirillaceae bacterium]